MLVRYVLKLGYWFMLVLSWSRAGRTSLGPAHDKLKTAKVQHKPAKDQHKPAKDQHKPAKDQHKPAKDQLKPAKDQFKPAKDQLKPAKDQHTMVQNLPNLFFFSTGNSFAA